MTSMHLAEVNSGSNRFLALASLDQAALDALPEAVYLCAPDGRVVRFNQKAVELWGRAPNSGDPEERFCGSLRLYRTDGSLLPHDQCPVAAALQTGESFNNQEVMLEQPSGRRLTVLANIAALKDKDGRVKGAINCFKDITDRKHAEAALRESERRFREVIDALPAAIYTTDAEGRITHFNPAAVAFAGRAPELGTDQWCVTWKLFHPDGTPMPHDQCPMAVALKEGRAVRGAEAIAERPDGTRVWFTPYPSPLCDDSGRIAGAVNMLVDITERKRVEARIQADADALIRLNELSARLWSMRSQRDGLDEMLAATMEMLGADFGNVQLLDETRSALTIEAQRGFSQDFLDFFREVSADRASTCGRALRTGERIIVEDVEADASFAPMRHVCRAAGFRAVQSTPLLGRDGRPLGMISTHFRAVHRPSEQELRRLDLYARQASDFIERCRADEAVHRAQAQREAELADTKLLASVSAESVREENVQVVYEKIVDAAMSIMGSDYASMHVLCRDRGELRLLAFRGFSPQTAKFWEWVRTDSNFTCGFALAKGRRCIEPDVANSRLMAGTSDQATYLQIGIRAAQSTPLLSRGGKLVGMISTHWKQPHQPTERDLRLLDLLARQAADLIDRRKAEDALRESEERFRIMADHAPVMVWVTEADGSCTFLGRSWYEFTGQTPYTGLGFGWLEAAHPDDRASAHKAFVDARREAFRLEYRIRRHDGEFRWVIDAGAPRFGKNGAFLGYIGSVIDITARRQAEETQRLLVNELDHRVKNTLASVQAIVQQTLRTTKDPAAFADTFAGRIQSLARVHSLLTETTWKGADLRDLIHGQLLQGAVDETRITAWGPPVRLEAEMALHFALVVHELGTNAHKHGALSVPAGWVTIGWRVEGHWLRLRWEERGGPSVISPARQGFGTTLIEQSVKSEGGSARMCIERDGLRWEIALPLPAKIATDIAPSCASGMISSVLPPQPMDRPAKPPGKLAGQRFLVVEDNFLVALDIAAGLEQTGAEVVASTASAKEALDLVEREALDAALLDGSLHGAPVDEIAAALTRHKVPFLFVTGFGRESLPQAFRNVAVLSKPFSPQQLAEAAARLVERRADVVRLRDN
jgi:PAS domain S-box-containing protein